MEPQELADAFVSAFNARDYDRLMGYVTDDFTFSGPVPQPVGAEQWLGLARAMEVGMPDADFRLHTMGVEGNVIKTGTQVTGTHTGDFDLTPMGFGVIPATGKSFSTPHEEGRLTVEGDKISSYHIDVQEGGGLMGILGQLGVQPPAG